MSKPKPAVSTLVKKIRQLVKETTLKTVSVPRYSGIHIYVEYTLGGATLKTDTESLEFPDARDLAEEIVDKVRDNVLLDASPENWGDDENDRFYDSFRQDILELQARICLLLTVDPEGLTETKVKQAEFEVKKVQQKAFVLDFVKQADERGIDIVKVADILRQEIGRLAKERSDRMVAEKAAA